MNYRELLEAHKKFLELEPRYFFYDGYIKTKDDFWFRNGKINENEIKKLRYFIRSWDPHFSGSINKLNECFKKIHRDIMALKNKSIDRINLCDKNTKKHIKKIFNPFGDCGKKNRFESTDASKIIHIILPKLFVMWDNSIRNGMWKDRKWKKPKKFKGEEYVAFLLLMRNEAKDIIDRYREQKHCPPKQAISEIEKKGSDYTLAKLIDEYNYIKYTKKIDP